MGPAAPFRTRLAAGWSNTFRKAGAWSWRAPATRRTGTPRKASTRGSVGSSRRHRESCAADFLGDIDMSQGAEEAPMARIVAFHKRPPDPAAWLEYYRDVHIPLVLKIPGVRNI